MPYTCPTVSQRVLEGSNVWDGETKETGTRLSNESRWSSACNRCKSEISVGIETAYLSEQVHIKVNAGVINQISGKDHPVHPMSKSNHDFLSGNDHEMKHLALGHKIHNKDSSSESGQSHQEASAVSETSLNEHTSSQSDSDEGHGKHNQDTVKSVLSMGKHGSAFSPPNLDYSPSFACLPYSADAYYGGGLTGYPPHAVVHPQQNQTTNAPVVLPVEPAAEEPIYVNAKQYHAILRRRQTRAKLEAQNKLVKGRKPYLHESRHRHAMKRARGSGGRFLNTKQLQEQNQQHEASGGSSCSKVIGNNNSSESDPTPTTPSAPASTDTASASRANQDRTCFPSAGFRPAMNFNEQGGGSAKLVK